LLKNKKGKINQSTVKIQHNLFKNVQKIHKDNIFYAEQKLYCAKFVSVV